MTKGRKMLENQMNSAGQKECILSNSLFATDIPVWYQKSGKVSPLWLSICEKERTQTTNLLEKVADPINLQNAYKQVRRNGGSSGIDKISIAEFGKWFKDNYKILSAEILSGDYQPTLVKGVKIAKPKGGYRQLGIPTIKDRVIQQAIKEVLQPIYDTKFSEQSFGFRPKRSAHQALKRASEIVKRGKTIVVDLDLAKFFDEVNHQRLMWLLKTRIGDIRLLKLIHKILKTGILEEGVTSQRIKGTPQGSPLSPLLSNIVLDELDQELNRRGLEYVRYADDVKIFVKSKISAERVYQSIVNFIENKMKLKVNRDKSKIQACYKVNFLGYSLLYKGKLGLSKSSEDRLKDKIREVTKRNRGVSLEQLIHELEAKLRGWLNYFILAEMKSKLQKIEGWIRRKLKCYRLKQCKRVISIVRFLSKLEVEKKLSWKTALSGKGWWRLSNSPALNIGMNNQWFKELGLYSLTDNYERHYRII